MVGVVGIILCLCVEASLGFICLYYSGMVELDIVNGNRPVSYPQQQITLLKAVVASDQRDRKVSQKEKQGMEHPADSDECFAFI